MPDTVIDSAAAAATAGQAREVALVAAGALAWFGDNPAKVKQEAIALGREFLKPETVHQRLAELSPRAAAKPVDHLTEDDVYDLQEYFERHFKGEPTVKTLGTAFWARAAQLAPLLDGAARGRLFGLLWADI